MKAARSLFIVLTLVLAGLSFINFAAADDSVKKELEAIYAKMDKAIKAKDLKTLETFYAEDFELIMDGKAHKRAEAWEVLKKQIEMMKEFSQVKTTIEKIQHVEGNEVADVKYEVKGTIILPDGKDGALDVVGKSREFWQKGEDGKWLMNTSEDLGSEVKINGQIVK